ncbi:MAG TPA: DUF4062 domain-containing protein [Chitinophagaceae bacterium]|nr:DUF4062 domain-containing protein [Chitinophagaceae bacterium]
MKKITVFISSAQTELECEREISQEIIADLNLHPVLFELHPALSSSPTPGFLNEVHQCDIFVLLLWKSLRPAVRAEYQKAIEKNKPVLVLVKRTNYNEKRDEDLETFLSQLTNENVNHMVRSTVGRDFRSLKELRELLRSSLVAEISKLYQEPISTQDREEMYNLGTEIIKHSQSRLHIFQKTPTLFLGLKDRARADSYNLDTYQHYEMDFMMALENWIERHQNSKDIEFTYLFDADISKKELLKSVSEENKKSALENIFERIKKFKKIEQQTNYKFKFMYISTPISGPLIIGDNRFAIWITGNEESVSFSQENEKIATILTKTLRPHFRELKSADELIEKLKF